MGSSPGAPTKKSKGCQDRKGAKGPAGDSEESKDTFKCIFHVHSHHERPKSIPLGEPWLCPLQCPCHSVPWGRARAGAALLGGHSCPGGVVWVSQPCFPSFPELPPSASHSQETLFTVFVKDKLHAMNVPRALQSERTALGPRETPCDLRGPQSHSWGHHGSVPVSPGSPARILHTRPGRSCSAQPAQPCTSSLATGCTSSLATGCRQAGTQLSPVRVALLPPGVPLSVPHAGLKGWHDAGAAGM